MPINKKRRKIIKGAKAKKRVEAKEFIMTVKGLLKEHIVGIVQEEEEEAFSFHLPGGKTFYISAEERGKEGKNNSKIFSKKLKKL